ncbi:MAG: 30S ribosomal protein S17 [Pseudobdellovibrionaceae bacterium]|nr:30S ribosomal protein S17 [Pseudobdellovibrionaceae bacterium]
MEQQVRGKRTVLKGRVISDKMDKSRVVLIERIVKHPKYGKYIKRRKKVMAHDENNATKQGDLVKLMECRPLSKRKRFRIVV